ncbi:hypothetical protein [Chamaesiphon sp. OTE_20_metabat_361]|uniref:hypothetical protein n=1 Tax=Chamaesiphon sp. OTE_20_metabat_361 TaxID=2964689 RepID=UPI00286C208D|nr:hypothetical protein [Chamaesiphon sp. OTE_20_metabat_361]
MSFNSQPDDRDNLSEAELMDCLLAATTTEYPWNPADPDTADYYTQTDSQFNLDDWSEAEIADRSSAFFTQIQSCWDTTSAAPVSPLAAISERFGTRVPQQWLAQIAANVGALATSNLEPVEQLVKAVGDLLSNWATDDLLVMARPYAYAMRCNPGVDEPDNIVRPLAWEQLSELERAKFTMLIARYAIDSL